MKNKMDGWLTEMEQVTELKRPDRKMKGKNGWLTEVEKVTELKKTRQKAEGDYYYNVKSASPSLSFWKNLFQHTVQIPNEPCCQFLERSPDGVF